MRHRPWQFFMHVSVSAVLLSGTAFGWAQQESHSGTPSVGTQAVSVVLKHYAMNPLALTPKTGHALPGDGTWSLSKSSPASCPQTKETCVGISYQVPAESVRCYWVVLLNEDGTDGTFLEENDDSEHYLLRKVLPGEATTLVDRRQKPLYPPIAMAAHISGTVVMEAMVGKSGEVQKIALVSGPTMVQPASLDAARQWSFKPMMVGSRAVPYEIQLVFAFRTTGPPIGTVETTP